VILKGSTLLAGICLSVFHSNLQAQLSADTIEAYQDQNWQVAITQLESQKDEPGAMRLLALSYYQSFDFEQALPALKQALSLAPDDVELNSALLDALLARQMNVEAVAVANHLEQLGATDIAMFGRAQVDLLDGDRSLAKEQLHTLVEEADPELAARAADILVETLYADHEYDWAHEVTQTIIQRDPDSPLANRYSWYSPENATPPGFRTDLGYRFEYDDNVTVPDTDFASGEEDYRHVLMADVLYEHPFGDNWSFYAQGHFLQTLHQEFDQFDLTRISVSAAIGRASIKTGWRLPVEIEHDRLDGDSFRTSLIALPGFYVQFGGDYFSHFYARLQSDDYEFAYFPAEDKSGSIYGGGVLVVGQVSARFKIHSYLEYNQHDTDGLNWQRDEIIAFAYGEFDISPKWVAGLALRYQKEDFDNTRRIFADPQENDSKEIYINLTHQLTRKWRFRGQISLVNHESNIAIFDYDRNVYSVSVVREF
jgi:tetratricopeptide (TPR) repeat protein